MLRVLLALAVCLMGPVSATAHEFWIEPVGVASNQKMPLRFVVRIGERFDGESYPFEPRAYRQALLVTSEGRHELSNRPLSHNGSDLAAGYVGPGLLAVEGFYQSNSYPSEQAFADFVSSVGQAGHVNTASASLTADGVVQERFRRISKTLFGQGGFRKLPERLGMEFEWVGHGNGFQLLKAGQPLPDQVVQLTCRHSPNPEIVVSSGQTRADGTVSFDIPDQADCLLNAVVIRRQGDGSWTSDWVSLFFKADSAPLPQ